MFLIILAVGLLIGGLPLLADNEYTTNGIFCVVLGILIIAYKILACYQPFAHVRKSRKSMSPDTEQPEYKVLVHPADEKQQFKSILFKNANSKNEQIDGLISKINDLQSEITTLEGTCNMYKKDIARIYCELSNKDDIIAALNQRLMAHNNYEEAVSSEELSTLKFQLEYSEARNAKLNITITKQQALIEKLKLKIVELEDKK